VKVVAVLYSCARPRAGIPLSVLRNDLEDIIEKRRKLTVLARSLDENAASKVGNEERLRVYAELVDMLGQLSVSLVNFQQRVAKVMSPAQREIEGRRCELLKLMSSREAKIEGL